MNFEEATRLPNQLKIPDFEDPFSSPKAGEVPQLFNEVEAGKLVTMFSSEGWETLQIILDKFKEDWNQPCEVYMKDPQQAVYDSGLRCALTLISHIKNDAQMALEYYAKSKTA
jgi:hypothetical protein